MRRRRHRLEGCSPPTVGITHDQLPCAVVPRAGEVTSVPCCDSHSFRRVADRFYVVTVEIEDERAIVARVILWPHARSTVVPTTRTDSRLVERAHFGPAPDHERDVQRRRRPAVATDPELRLAILAEAASGHLARRLLRPYFHYEGDAERPQSVDVEGLRARMSETPQVT